MTLTFSSPNDGLATPATTLGSPHVLSSKPLESSQAKFIDLNALTYRASNGTERQWESTNRKTRSKDVIADAIDIFTILTHPTLPRSTIIVLQFRAPINSISVEIPAGLIDEGETPETAALRELAEETGYGSSEHPNIKGRVVNVSKPCADSPGMSTETTVLCTVKVEISEAGGEFPDPKQNLDEGEFIEKRIVPIKGLYQTLQAYQELGYTVDTRLHHFAYGLTMASELDLA